MSAARILISAAHRSSGKTTVTLGIAAALTQRGLAVQTFKKGPDYIDPMWLARASGRPCFNLDPHLSTPGEIAAAFAGHAAGADVNLIEGNLGLYDGLALDGSDSNAALATRLGLPVLLVIDARGMTRGIAPLVLGYQAFDRTVRIAGIVLNNVGGARHESKLRAVIEHYTDVPVLGAVQRDVGLAIVERELGLVPGNEATDAQAAIERIAKAVAAQIDLDRVLAVARDASPLAPAAKPIGRAGAARDTVRVGIAQDRAFGFYYADDLQALRDAGAELVAFDTLRDTQLPAVDALFIGGGFPERFAPQLQANSALRAQIRAALDAGMPAYAECGGLMYLARSLTVDGRSHAMVGAIPGDVVMHARAVGRGYVELDETGAAPWRAAATAAGGRLHAHEFHHSSLDNLDPGVRFAYRVMRGHGIDGRNDGIVVNNLLASYAHLRSVGDVAWASQFIDFARSVRARPRARSPHTTGAFA